MGTQVRQGDVMLIPCNVKPTTKLVKTENGRTILAHGEVTGHHHSLETSVAHLFGGDHPVLVVDAPTPLEHQEHAPIKIQPGTYWVVRQKEYTPAAIVRVQD